MQIRNRLFSYPVYSNDTDDYKTNGFVFDYDVENNGDFIKILYFAKIQNEHIINRIQQDIIKLAVLIECPKTAYRQLFILDKLKGTLEIPSQVLSARVELCCILIANKDFVISREFDINLDYLDTIFSIKKGFIIGYDNTYPFIVDKDKEDNFKASSIISVVKKLDLENYMDINLDNDDKINIQLGEEMYQYFVQLQGQDKLPIVHSMVVLPALVYVIEQIKDITIRETYEDYYWYRCIAKQLEILKIDIDSPSFENRTSLSIAQELLKCPLKNALITLTSSEGGD